MDSSIGWCTSGLYIENILSFSKIIFYTNDCWHLELLQKTDESAEMLNEVYKKLQAKFLNGRYSPILIFLNKLKTGSFTFHQECLRRRRVYFICWSKSWLLPSLCGHFKHFLRSMKITLTYLNYRMMILMPWKKETW